MDVQQRVSLNRIGVASTNVIPNVPAVKIARRENFFHDFKTKHTGMGAFAQPDRNQRRDTPCIVQNREKTEGRMRIKILILVVLYVHSGTNEYY